MIKSAIAMLVLAVGGAYFQAEEHAHLIRNGLMSRDVKRGWTGSRALLLGVAAFIAWTFGASLMACLLLLVAAWCVWTAVFRWRLNKAMGWDRYYMGSTSRYDLLMISLVLFAKNWRWPNVVGIKTTHQGAYQFDGYRADVHSAGRLAYAVELIVSAACYIFALVAAGVS